MNQPPIAADPGTGIHQPSQGASFRNFASTARPSVKELYALNHRHQTVDLVAEKKREFLPLRRLSLGMWEALEKLSAVVDDSDCDLENPQIDHALQTAEALRRDGHPRWLVLTGLIHDAGKILHLFGEPQWAVVGDTFPVGCEFQESIVHHDLFRANDDTSHQGYSRRLGVYSEGCGLDSVQMSWGHDEYLYHVVRPFLPPEAAYIIRYHSFYAAHHAGDYGFLMNEYDRLMMGWVRSFSSYDLYSKDIAPPNHTALGPYYRQLVAEYFPPSIQW